MNLPISSTSRIRAMNIHNTTLLAMLMPPDQTIHNKFRVTAEVAFFVIEFLFFALVVINRFVNLRNLDVFEH